MDEKTAKKILDSVKEVYTKIASEFDNTRKTLWPGFQEFLNYIKDGDRILDVGSGSGRLSLLTQNKKVNYVGVDNNPELLKIAKKNFPENTFVLGDMLALPFINESFDVVFCIAAFHHLPDRTTRQKALQEMIRMMKPGGTLIMTNWLFFHDKYVIYWLKNIFLKFLGKSHLGFKDALIPWGGGPKRYYHQFCKRELRKLFETENLRIERMYVMRYSEEKNLVIIAKKM